MNTPSAAPHAAEEQQKPGWSLPVVLSGATGVVLRLGDVWSWWALLWVPLLALAVATAVYGWRLLARSRWRMDPLQWGFLALSHLGLVASLTAIWRATH
ncbi:hypothetical protein [Streptomyces sp. NBC_01565]|uniref:hypothetical protein n=1 Tax=Streptomyces sp. NBC_01565 TaxID=2975881 RepID=UPI002253C083|nr:hypothetical protein [Streptomyces sp. NBC_01565]MCX4546449.1 hypothetical protein [Streptomyces sp. NBC_01565]